MSNSNQPIKKQPTHRAPKSTQTAPSQSKPKNPHQKSHKPFQKNINKAKSAFSAPMHSAKNFGTHSEFKPEAPQDNLRIMALGGLGEVGKNCYVVEYKDEIIVIDAGVKFPESYQRGIDYVIPNFTYLKQNEHKIKGLFVTHGHEDHIGGIPFLLKQLKIPVIYSARLSIGLIEHKLEEHKLLKATKLVSITDNDMFTYENLQVSFFQTTHSIPDAYGVFIDTPYGRIVQTGDFKVDLTPVGKIADFYKLTKAGHEGVLLMMSDSTNAEVPGFTTSESLVGQNVFDIVEKLEGRVIFATFASNIHRLQQIIEASEKLGRKIAVFGRSMDKAISIGRTLGYIRAKEETFIDPKHVNKYPAHRISMLCTGSQGEPLAALSRIAGGQHKQITIAPGDSVLFASNPIPGNAHKVGKIIDLLYRSGANVFVNDFYSIHTSGHGAQEEQKLLIQLIKPKYFMPIHGDYRMLSIHAKLATTTGISKENTFVMDNGDALVFSKDKKQPYITRNVVPGEAVYVDGSGIGDIQQPVILERELFSKHGIVVPTAAISTNGKILVHPKITTRGFIFVKDSIDLIKELQYVVRKVIERYTQQAKKIEIRELNNEITENLSKLIFKRTKRSPMIMPIISLIDERKLPAKQKIVKKVQKKVPTTVAPVQKKTVKKEMNKET